MELNADYWNQRYEMGSTPWDVGAITPSLKQLIDRLTDKQIRILIPGAGYAHEAIYLHKKGFTEVYVCDWAPAAIAAFQREVPDFPKQHLIVDNFFNIQQPFDLIIEQTFFCALPPAKRPAYAKKTANLLQNKGILAGLLFAEPFPFEGPPFGGTPAEYQRLFLPYYDFVDFSPAEHSIAPRAGNELFIYLRKKSSH